MVAFTVAMFALNAMSPEVSCRNDSENVPEVAVHVIDCTSRTPLVRGSSPVGHVPICL